jgi:hypothetical protein
MNKVPVFSKYAFKEAREERILNFSAVEFCCSFCSPSQKQFFETVFFEDSINETRI